MIEAVPVIFSQQTAFSGNIYHFFSFFSAFPDMVIKKKGEVYGLPIHQR